MSIMWRESPHKRPVMRKALSCHYGIMWILMKKNPHILSVQNITSTQLWAQVEWWLEHRHGWLIKHQWAGSVLGWVTRDEYQVRGSTSIPTRLDTLVYWESFSWLTSVGTTRNTVNRLGWSRIGPVVLILHAAGAGLIGRPAVISGRYNKCHSLQLQNHYAHFPPLQHTHSCKTQLCGTGHGKWSWVSRHCMLAVAGGILCDRVKRPIGHLGEWL